MLNYNLEWLFYILNILAYTEEGPEQFLYSVRFRLKDLWAEYDGNMNDTIEIDIF